MIKAEYRTVYSDIFQIRVGQYGRTLETALKTTLKKGNFLKACLKIISGEKSVIGDTSDFPLGSDKEESEDQAEISRDGDRALQNAAQAYNSDKVCQYNI